MFQQILFSFKSGSYEADGIDSAVLVKKAQPGFENLLYQEAQILQALASSMFSLYNLFKLFSFLIIQLSHYWLFCSRFIFIKHKQKMLFLNSFSTMAEISQ